MPVHRQKKQEQTAPALPFISVEILPFCPKEEGAERVWSQRAQWAIGLYFSVPSLHNSRYGI